MKIRHNKKDYVVSRKIEEVMKMKIQKEDMTHVCDETKLVFVKQEGDLITYRCPECNNEIYSMVCIPIEQLIRQISED